MKILWRFLLRHTALLDLERERMGGSRASQSNPGGFVPTFTYKKTARLRAVFEIDRPDPD
ncbi:hypothetical protein AOX55_00001944 [Sinorhizobium fredii CCBAU 25509]|nr:hypothetical protein AOX55_00001944 [Sinorhizobium fredii CCBAU 25509]